MLSHAKLATRAVVHASRAATTAAAAAPRPAYKPRQYSSPRPPPARSATPSASTSTSKPTTAPARSTPSLASPVTAAKPPVASSSSPSTPPPAAPKSGPAFDDIPPEFDAPPLPSVSSSFAAPATATAPGAGSSFVRATPLAPFPSSGAPTPPADSPFVTASTLPPSAVPQGPEIDWSTSYHGLSAVPFTREQAAILMRPLGHAEIEIKPDGLIYLPEILYRRILNQAFGPGGWGMVPRGEMTVLKNMVTREWGLVSGGRLVSVARGEQTFFDPSGMPTATEGCKSNALMRCCKDLGIASELWDPSFIRAYKATHCVEAWTEHVVSKKKQKRWRKKHNKFEYPYAEARM